MGLFQILKCICFQEDRGHWHGRFDFFFVLLACTYNPGMILRFPYMCQMYGAAFLIPYFMSLILIGLPLIALELALGQFTSSGVLTCWKFAPVVQGIGLAKVILTAIVNIYVSVLCSVNIYYMVVSFGGDPLPWATCDESCALSSGSVSDACVTVDIVTEKLAECVSNGGTISFDKSECITNTSDYPKKRTPLLGKFPSEYYFTCNVTGEGFSSGLEEPGPVRWQIALCNLACFVLVFFTLIKTTKTYGKVAYVTTILPVVLMVYLLVEGLSLPGHEQGIKAFFDVDNFEKDLKKLTEDKSRELTNHLPNWTRVWKDAALTVLFSYTTSYGAYVTIASYNRFNYNFVRDLLIVVVINFGITLLIGYTMFTYIGYFAELFAFDVQDMPISIVGLEFPYITLAYTFSTLPRAAVLSSTFYLALLLIMLNFQFMSVETIRTAIIDVCPSLRKYRTAVLFVVCTVLYLLGLLLTTNGGMYWLGFLDTVVIFWPYYTIAIFECLAVIYLYGIMSRDGLRFLKDMQLMIGTQSLWTILFIFPLWFLVLCWAITVPVGMILLLYVRVYRYVNEDAKNVIGWLRADVEYDYEWTNYLAWLIAMTVIVAFIIGAQVAFVRAEGSVNLRIVGIIKPTTDWGPLLHEHRQLDSKYDNNADVQINDFTNEQTRPQVTDTTCKDSPQAASDVLFVNTIELRDNPPPYNAHDLHPWTAPVQFPIQSSGL